MKVRKAPGRLPGSANHPLLQWGRTREGAEGIVVFIFFYLFHKSFSGAAPVKVRKDAQP